MNANSRGKHRGRQGRAAPSWPTSGWASPAWPSRAMLHRDGIARAGGPERLAPRPTADPHFAPKAKNVIWLFMIGGTSHIESFDPKPALDEVRRQDDRRDAAQGRARLALLEEEPPRVVVANTPMAASSRRSTRCRSATASAGRAGIEVSDWWPHLGGCIDDIAVVRSMWTTDNDHGAQLQFHTGRHIARRARSRRSARGSTTASARSTTTCRSSWSWARRSPTAAAAWAATAPATSAPSTTASSSSVDPRNPLPFASPGPERVSARNSGDEFDLLGRLNRLSAVAVSRRSRLAARIKSYELAFRMQTAVPEVVRFDAEAPRTRSALRARHDATRAVRPAMPGGPAAGRARGPVRAGLPRQQRRRRGLGRAQRPHRRATPGSAGRSTSRSPACSGT